MRFLIHFEIDDVEDEFVVESETTERARALVVEGMRKRGLDEEKNNCWSEKV